MTVTERIAVAKRRRMRFETTTENLNTTQGSISPDRCTWNVEVEHRTKSSEKNQKARTEQAYQAFFSIMHQWSLGTTQSPALKRYLVSHPRVSCKALVRSIVCKEGVR